MKTFFTNARVLLSAAPSDRVVVVEDHKIIDITSHFKSSASDRVIDCNGLYLSPGFVDIHVHGGGGYSAMSGRADDIVNMCNAHALFGTTSILPTTLASPMPALMKAVEGIKAACALPCAASILGVHIS